MAYEARHLRRPKVRYNDTNDDNKLTMQLVSGGAKLTPTSATIAIYSPSGTAIVAATATGITISGTLLTYAVVTTTTASYPVAKGYRAEWIITSSTLTYEEQQIFDVANLVPFGRISFDQLLALDDRIKGMEHGGDEDFSELIEACRDEIQYDIESKVIDGGKMLEDMILDQTRLAVPARNYILAQIFFTKGDEASRDYYMSKYNAQVRMLLAGAFDKNQDLNEEQSLGRVQTIRLRT